MASSVSLFCSGYLPMSVSMSSVLITCFTRSLGFMPAVSSRFIAEPRPSEITLPPTCFTQSLYSPAQSMMKALVPHTYEARVRKVFTK